MRKIITFIKQEIVFFIACLLAAVSCFFVPPSKDYVNYIDFRTLALLLALMLVIQGMKSCGLFDTLVRIFTAKVRNTRQLAIILILLCYFSSMLITNDVALITFIPFSIMLLTLIDSPSLSIYIIVLETMAANLGSMLTPIGNPQNLYLYSLSGISLGEFMLNILPYSTASLILLVISCLFIKKNIISNTGSELPKAATLSVPRNRFKLVLYIILFCVCILTVLRILDYRIMLAIVIVCVIILDISLLSQADYILLLTFVAFFIFVGNIRNINQVSELLSKLVSGRECYLAIGVSQLISNVPAAMLLSGFTDRIKALTIGINLGGLGTLIASMASLISYKFYAKTEKSNTGRYILTFALLSVVFLLILIPLYMIIG